MSALRWRKCFLMGFVLVTFLVSAGPAHPAQVTIDPQVHAALQKEDQTSIFIILEAQADLGLAFAIEDWKARGAFVVNQLQTVATISQQKLRQDLRADGITFESFWIVNALRVTVDRSTAQRLAQRPEVAQIVPDMTYTLPKPQPSQAQAQRNGVEWGIDRIRAPEVWSTFGVRGEGIVVANIDTGAQYDHPALVSQYRGRRTDGSFDHNYNWFDPSNVCDNPSTVPCDNDGHGTHTMGTMVGSDGDSGSNQIGVAPQARWIAAKGCESSSCSYSALLAAGQWMLAPTDLNGQNPRVDLRPHIINNSWGGRPRDPFYQHSVQAWVAAGIFPVFANGNWGPVCQSAGSPGDYPESYSVGAFDSTNAIADFSSRGASALDGGVKPNIAAPGVDVRSSVPGNTYEILSGTSMAAPHVAGTIALLWSASPILVGDVAATRALIDQNAIDVEDLQCGGTAASNNVWGEGRLDALTAVEQAPRGPSGWLRGMVSDAHTTMPIAGVTVQTIATSIRTRTTQSDGVYHLRLSVGAYTVQARAFGYEPQTTHAIAISEGLTTTHHIALTPVARYSVTGVVRDTQGRPIVGALVTIRDTPLATVTTDAQGQYRFASVPEGIYTLSVSAVTCYTSQQVPLQMQGDTTQDITLPQRLDTFGYTCTTQTAPFIEAQTVLPLSGDDEASVVGLPFPFMLYGHTHNAAYITTNGFLGFTETADRSYLNRAIPDEWQPNDAIYPFWDDLFVDNVAASVRTETIGVAPRRQFVIEWRNVRFYASEQRVRFAVLLGEDGQIQLRYADIDPQDRREQGNSATVGIENPLGTMAFQTGYNQSILRNNLLLEYTPPPLGILTGRVSNANDTLPVRNAKIRAMRDGVLIESATTGADGTYHWHLPIGRYTLEVQANQYHSESVTLDLIHAGTTLTQDMALKTGRAVLSQTALEFIQLPGQSRSHELGLTNTGTVDLTWELQERGSARLPSRTTGVMQRNPHTDPNALTTTGLFVQHESSGGTTTGAGAILRSWTPTGMRYVWGLGYTGTVWISEPYDMKNHEFEVEGVPTGRIWPTPINGYYAADMAYDTTHNLMCQVNVGGNNGISCWQTDTGNIVATIAGDFPWTQTSQRGLAYRAEDDTFFISGWNQGILYQIKGLSHPDKGTVVSQCRPADEAIAGLAWNPVARILWMSTNSPDDTIYALDPVTCATLATVPHPNPGYNGAGLEMNENGDLWTISQFPNMVYLINSGVIDVPWLTTAPTSGTLPIGERQMVTLTIDTTGLEAGVYDASLVLHSNSGRDPAQHIPIRLIVPAYQQGVNAGGADYTDTQGDPWAADRAFSAGGWGYVPHDDVETARTHHPIAGTEDDVLYQSARTAPGRYRFEQLPNGVYQVELRLAEIEEDESDERVFDVGINGTTVLTKHDIVKAVGGLTANDHSFFVTVSDGKLDIQLTPRSDSDAPLLNALRVTHRPDR